MMNKVNEINEKLGGRSEDICPETTFVEGFTPSHALPASYWNPNQFQPTNWPVSWKHLPRNTGWKCSRENCYRCVTKYFMQISGISGMSVLSIDMKTNVVQHVTRINRHRLGHSHSHTHKPLFYNPELRSCGPLSLLINRAQVPGHRSRVTGHGARCRTGDRLL